DPGDAAGANKQTAQATLTFEVGNAAPKVTSVPKDQTVIPGSTNGVALNAGGGNFDLSDPNDPNGTDKGYTAVVEVLAKGGTLTYGGQTASRITVGDATTTLAGLQTLLDAVTYTPPSTGTIGDTVTVEITIADPNGETGKQKITFTLVNAPPRLRGNPLPQTVQELALDSNFFNFEYDLSKVQVVADDPGETLTLTMTLADVAGKTSSQGTLYHQRDEFDLGTALNSTGMTIGKVQVNHANNTYTFRGTTAELNSFLAKLEYRPGNNISGSQQTLSLELADTTNPPVDLGQLTLVIPNLPPELDMRDRYFVTPGDPPLIPSQEDGLTLFDFNDESGDTYTLTATITGSGGQISDGTITGNKISISSATLSDIDKKLEKVSYIPPTNAQPGSRDVITFEFTDQDGATGKQEMHFFLGNNSSSSYTLPGWVGDPLPNTAQPTDLNNNNIYSFPNARLANNNTGQIQEIRLINRVNDPQGEWYYQNTALDTEGTTSIGGVFVQTGRFLSGGPKYYNLIGTTNALNTFLSGLEYRASTTAAGLLNQVDISAWGLKGHQPALLGLLTITVPNKDPDLGVPTGKNLSPGSNVVPLTDTGTFALKDFNHQPGDTYKADLSITGIGGQISDGTITGSKISISFTSQADLIAKLNQISYVPPANAPAGSRDIITVTVTDQNGGTTQEDIPFTLVNAAPVLTAPSFNVITTLMPGDTKRLGDIGTSTKGFTLTDANDPGNATGYTAHLTTINGGAFASTSGGHFTNTLDLGSSTTTLNDLLTGLNNVVYQAPALAAGAPLLIQITVTDPDGGQSNLPPIFPFTLGNAAPEVTKPADRVVGPGTTGTALGAIILSDPNSPGKGDGGYEVTVALSSGVGSLAGAGSGFRAVAGATKTLSMTGTLAQLEADLAKVTYTPGNVQAGETGTITVTLKDPSGTTDDKDFTYTISNAEPVLTLPAVQTVAPGSGGVSLGRVIITDDNEVPAASRPPTYSPPQSYTASITVTNGPGTASVGSLRNAASLDGRTSLTLDQLRAALSNIQYVPPATGKINDQDRVTITITNTEGGVTKTVTETIDFTLGNVKPEITSVPNDQTVIPGSTSGVALNAGGGNFDLSDPNDPGRTDKGYTAVVEVPAKGGTLTHGGQTASRVTVGDATTTLAGLQALLDAVTYTPPATGAVGDTVTITVTVTDLGDAAGANKQTAQATLTFTMGNAKPTIAKSAPGVASSANVDPGVPHQTRNLSLISITDPNDPAIPSTDTYTLTLSGGAIPYLTGWSTIGATSDGHGGYKLSGDIVGLSNAVDLLQFTAPEVAAGTRYGLSLTVQDRGKQTSDPLEYTFIVNDVAPTLENMPENPVIIPVDVPSSIPVFSTKDNNDPNNKELRVLTLSGSALQYLSGWPSDFNIQRGELVLVGTQAELQAALRSIQHTPTNLGRSVLDIKIEDSSASSRGQITFDAVNMPPSLTLPTTTVSVDPRKTTNIPAGITINDHNDPKKVETYTANLSIAGVGGTLDTSPISGTPAQISAKLASLQYTPPLGANTGDSDIVTLTITDKYSTVSASQTITFTLNSPVVAPPPLGRLLSLTPIKFGPLFNKRTDITDDDEEIITRAPIDEGEPHQTLLNSNERIERDRLVRLANSIRPTQDVTLPIFERNGVNAIEFDREEIRVASNTDAAADMAEFYNAVRTQQDLDQRIEAIQQQQLEDELERASDLLDSTSTPETLPSLDVSPDIPLPPVIPDSDQATPAPDLPPVIEDSNQAASGPELPPADPPATPSDAAQQAQTNPQETLNETLPADVSFNSQITAAYNEKNNMIRAVTDVLSRRT
ncbi:MAG: hypothetical protein AAF442_06670, partial [Pseudomonadota bacterium]